MLSSKCSRNQKQSWTSKNQMSLFGILPGIFVFFFFGGDYIHALGALDYHKFSQGKAIVNDQSSFQPVDSDWGDERIVTAGLGIKTADISIFIIRSYDSHTGSLISEDEFDLSIDENTASSIEKGEGRIYAVGSGIDKHGALALLVRAYDAKKGLLLWEDSLTAKDRAVGYATSLHKKIQANASIVPFEQSPPHLSLSSYLVRSINNKTGKVVWKDEFMTNGEHIPQKMSNRIHTQQPFEEQSFSIQVRTFDFQTGKLLWKDQFNPLKNAIGPTDVKPQIHQETPTERNLSSNHT